MHAYLILSAKLSLFYPPDGKRKRLETKSLSCRFPLVLLRSAVDPPALHTPTCLRPSNIYVSASKWRRLLHVMAGGSCTIVLHIRRLLLTSPLACLLFIISLPANLTCAGTRTGEWKLVGLKKCCLTVGRLLCGTSLVPIPFEAYLL